MNKIVIEAKSTSRLRIVTTGVLLASFLAALEATVISPAMPTIIDALGGLKIYSWVFTAYMVALTVSSLIWGKLFDLFGRRICYLVSLGIFLVGSTVAGLAPSMGWLITCRVLQGLGAGALTPLGSATLAALYPLERRPQIQSVITVLWGIASLTGPLVGGFLAQHVTWRAVFWLNLPFGLLAVILLALFLPTQTFTPQKTNLDIAGSICFAILLTLFLLWLHSFGSGEYNLSLLSFGVVFLGILTVILVRIERRAANPLFDISLFHNRFFTGTALTMLLLGMLLYGAITYLPLFFQGVLGEDAVTAGRSLIPLMFTWVGLSSLSAWLAIKTSYFLTTIVGSLSCVIGFTILALIGSNASLLLLLIAAGCIGVGAGFCITPLVVGIQSIVPKDNLGVATSLILTCRSVGGSVGVTVMGAAVTFRLGALPQGAALTNPNLRISLEAGLNLAFMCGLGFAIALLLVTPLIPKRDPKQLANQNC